MGMFKVARTTAKVAGKAAGKAAKAAKDASPECTVCYRPIVGGGRKANMHPKCVKFAAHHY